MDKEVIQTMFRITGQVQCVAESVKRIRPMPNDRRTTDLLDSAQAVLDKAVLSAWQYALEADAAGSSHET